jgi:hypothetical protein
MCQDQSVPVKALEGLRKFNRGVQFCAACGVASRARPTEGRDALHFAGRSMWASRAMDVGRSSCAP